MPTYSHADFQQIAAALDIGLAAVTARADHFESAALWFRLDTGTTGEERRAAAPSTPSARLFKLKKIWRKARSLRENLALDPPRRERIEASTRRLLGELAIEDAAAAYDGPGDPEILQVLTFPAGITEDHVVALIRRIAESSESADLIEAAAELEALSIAAAEEVVRLGELTVPKGHHGDRAVNDWVAEMMGIYRAITGRKPGISVGAPTRDDEGIPGGPLIRFLAAAAKPLAIRPGRVRPGEEDEPNGDVSSARAWRSYVRRIRAAAPRQN